MEGARRKRDDEGTLVTFYTPNRTFSWVYRGQSFDKTKEWVRNKLRLSEDESIRLARLHEGNVIELDDDDDFDAFQHFTRFVSSVDVSVFVGQNGPPVFTQLKSQQTTVASKPRNKPHVPVPLGLSTTSSVSGELPTAQTASTTVVAVSTLNGDGVPHRKRKRRDIPLRTETTRSPTRVSSRSRELSVQRLAASNSHRDHNLASPTCDSSAIDPLGYSKTNAVFQKPAAVPRGAKRKRAQSRESASNPLPVEPLSIPNSPVAPPLVNRNNKKRRRKEKGPAKPPLPQMERESDLLNRAEQIGKAKSIAASTTSEVSEQTRVEEDAVVDAVSAPEERGARTMTTVTMEQSEDDVAQPITQNTATRDESSRASDVDSSQVVTDVQYATSPVVSSSAAPSTPLAPKTQKRKQKELENNSPSTVPASDSPAASSATPIEVGSGKRQAKPRKSRAPIVTEEIHLESPPSAGELVPEGAAEASPTTTPEVTEKKAKPRKSDRANASEVTEPTIPVDVQVGGAAVSATTPDVSESISTKKAKLASRKSSASSSEPISSDTMAAVQEAYLAILARGVSSSTAANPSTADNSLESPGPQRKKSTGKSKLSQAWGPNDMAGEQLSIASTSAVAVVPEPSSMPGPSHKPKAGNTKKARPSSVPICPVCENASIHPRSQCPVVTAGPASIRTRISQLKKSGENKELIEELGVLLKEAQRRRKTSVLPSVKPSPIQIPTTSLAPEEAPPSSPDLPLQLSTSFTKSSISTRSVSNPRLPAGSEISEVAVESKDEGSSNESSEDEDEIAAPPISSNPLTVDPAYLDTLLHGPAKPRGSIFAHLSSSSDSRSSSESDDSDDEQDQEEVDFEEDVKNDRAYRRMSRKFERAGSSSDDDQEPDVDNAEIDMDDVVVPLTTVDSGSTNSIQDAQEVEAGVLVADTSAVSTTGIVQNPSDDSESHESSSDAENPLASQPVSHGRNPASESSVSERGRDQATPSAGSEDGRCVENSTEVASPAPQAPVETIEGAAQTQKQNRLRKSKVTSSQESDEHSHSEHAEETETPAHRDNSTSSERAQSSEPGEPQPVPHTQVDPLDVNESGSDDDINVQVVEPHTEDPDDPIESFSSVREKEAPGQLDDDPIEDFDTEVVSRTHTPPPAAPSTPGTISRMRDRYGRSSQQNRSGRPLQRLSQQVLGDLIATEAELTLPISLAGDSQVETPSAQEELHRPEAENAQALQETAHVVEEPTEEESAPRPRRATRTTSRRVTVVSPSSHREGSSTLTPTPVPAPTQRRGVKLTEEEKARREAAKEAAKLEKAAERERKKAEKEEAKAAEKEAKAAAKRAEKDAKDAAKKAAKDAQEAAKRLAKEESTTRGSKATRARGRGGTAKPASTRKQKAAASAGADQAGDDRMGDEEPSASPIVAETPATAKVSWAVLPQTGPRTQTESVGEVESSMVDELQPSSPEPPGHIDPHDREDATSEATLTQELLVDTRDEDVVVPLVTPKPKQGRKDPLFIPSSSQFPHTPFAPAAESTPFGNGDPHDSDSDAPESQTNTAKVSRPRSSWHFQSLYPTLTNLASQDLFTASQIPSPALFSQTPRANSGKVMPNRSPADDDDDSSEEDSSDSESGKAKSHIPQGRRAGVGVQKKKKSGLLSAYD